MFLNDASDIAILRICVSGPSLWIEGNSIPVIQMCLQARSIGDFQGRPHFVSISNKEQNEQLV